MIKDIIIFTKKSRNNKRLLAIKNKDKTLMVKVIKFISTINLDNKYNSAINNSYIDIARDLILIDIKNY